MGKKFIVSVTYENERVSIKTASVIIKCVLDLSCADLWPFYGLYCKRFSLREAEHLNIVMIQTPSTVMQTAYSVKEFIF